MYNFLVIYSYLMIIHFNHMLIFNITSYAYIYQAVINENTCTCKENYRENI